MNIGQAAALSGLPVKTLRYYEEVGLVQPGRCEGNDYRVYSAEDVDHLRFLQRARAVGFSLEVCRELLDLYRNPQRRCSQVKALVLEKLAQVEQQLHELQSLKYVLSDMADSCLGDDTSACAIIETLANAGTAPGTQPAAQTKMPTMPFMLVEPINE